MPKKEKWIPLLAVVTECLWCLGTDMVILFTIGEVSGACVGKGKLKTGKKQRKTENLVNAELNTRSNHWNQESLPLWPKHLSARYRGFYWTCIFVNHLRQASNRSNSKRRHLGSCSGCVNNLWGEVGAERKTQNMKKKKQWRTENLANAKNWTRGWRNDALPCVDVSLIVLLFCVSYVLCVVWCVDVLKLWGWCACMHHSKRQTTPTPTSIRG